MVQGEEIAETALPNPSYGGRDYKYAIRVPAATPADEFEMEELVQYIREHGYAATGVYKEDKAGRQYYIIYSDMKPRRGNPRGSKPHVMRRAQQLAVSKTLSETPPNEQHIMTGPWTRVGSQTPVSVITQGKERGTKGRYLIVAHFFGRDLWGWVNKEDLEDRQADAVNPPRRRGGWGAGGGSPFPYGQVERFHPRWVPESLLPELSNLWHLSRVPKGNDRHARLVWTADEFHKAHPELGISSTAVYKDLTGMLEVSGVRNPRLSGKDPRSMTPGEINKELKRLSQLASINNQAYIEAGRGDWRPSDPRMQDTSDPLNKDHWDIYHRRQQLVGEVERQMGPGHHEFPWDWGRRFGRRRNPDDPNESVQGKSYREWTENFARVSGDPEHASVKDLYRAINFLDHERGRMSRRAWEQGLKLDANTVAGYDNEEQYYRRLIREKEGGKRNPEAAADSLYESFHGRPPQEEVMVEEEFHEHDHLASIGMLDELVVDCLSGVEATLTFQPGEDQPYLASSEDGKQLYIVGGNQEIDLHQIKMDSDKWVKDRMILGQFAPPEPGSNPDKDNGKAVLESGLHHGKEV